jgi:hypothetical protein
MTSSLVMDVETGTKKRRDHFFGFENREFGRHARRGLGDGNRHPLRRDFSDVARNRFTGLQGAFQVTANRVSRHLASIL